MASEFVPKMWKLAASLPDLLTKQMAHGGTLLEPLRSLCKNTNAPCNCYGVCVRAAAVSMSKTMANNLFY